MPLDPTIFFVPATSMGQREWGRIQSVGQDEQVAHRLAEMGIRPGVQIQVVRHGKPSLIIVDGRKYSMRAEDLEEILVEVLANPGHTLS